MVDFNSEIRTIDGTGNQPEDYGRAGGEVIRIFPNAYEDGFNSPRGGGVGEEESTLPNARDISNVIAAQGDARGNPLNASDWLWQWGQFLDHDLSISEGSNISELPDEEAAELQFDIPLDPTDVLYGGERFTEIPVNRIEAEEGTGTGPDNIREFPNEITSFIDGSNGYGSDNERAAAKRSDLNASFFGVGTEGVPSVPEGTENPYDGKLLVANDSYGTDGVAFEDGSDPNNRSNEILAPYNRNNSPNADPGDRVPNDQEFISGDLRINEQSGLIAVHTLLIREHNKIADKVAFHLDRGDDAALNAAFEQYRTEYVPSLELESEPSEAQIRGEFIYEAARAVIGGKSQVITYEEFLPILVGNESPDDLAIIDESIMDPSISAEFSTAAYRLGHTLLSDSIRTIGAGGTGSISLRDAFFTPDFISNNGLDDILVGLNYQQANDADHRVIDGVRNNLFGPPGNGGQDLVAINLQRGRDAGLPGYVEIYNQLNPDSTITSFDDLDALFGEEVATLFENAYESIDQIDLWLAGLAEQPAEEGTLLGPTFKAIIEDQFARLRDYDSNFYIDELEDPESFLSVVSNAIDLDLRNADLDDIIRDNVDTPELVPEDAFRVPFENERTGTLESDRGDSAISGTEVADLIFAQTGNDQVFGGEGDDIIFGEVGNDELAGQAGADTLVGGEGDDILQAQGAGDVLSGGNGDDTYRFFTESAGNAIVTDDGGTDTISITNPRPEGSDPESGRPEVELLVRDPNPAFMGLRKSENDLQIDINQDGIINPETDLVISDYFADGEDGQVVAGAGAIENINNVTTEELLEYANSDEIANGSPIFRFLNPALGVHFYTADEGERDNILNDPGLSEIYDFEGESYIGAPHDEDALTGAKPVFRFLNTETQVHFYTISEAERDNVLTDPGLSSVFSFEGVAYYGNETPIEGYTPLYRFLNTNVDTPAHFYTPSAAERDNLLNDPGLSSVYQPEGNEEGAAFYIQPLEI